MPLAMANSLMVSIVVFTSLSSSPVFFVSPRSPPTEVLYLAYTSYGPGHYDGVVFAGINKQVKVKCRCGVNPTQNDKENYVACMHRPERHSSCKCLIAGISCSQSCGCKGCSNPNGKRPCQLGKRKREHHSWQDICIPNKTFALSKGDVLAHGVWSDFENMVFSKSIRYMECNHMDCNSSTLDTVFNSVAKYITAPHCSVELPPDIVLRIKSPSQLENKLRHYQIEQELVTKTSTR